MEQHEQLSDLVTEAYRPVIKAYNQYVRDCAQATLQEHGGSHGHAGFDPPSACYDCTEALNGCADSEWSMYTRNAYLVMIISPNRDTWKDISLDIDAFGEDFDTCMASCAVIAIAADIQAELERMQ